MNLKKLNVDAFLISNEHNKRYLTGFTGSTCEVILFETKNIFLTDGRYITQSKKEVNENFTIEIADTQVDYFTKIIEVLKREKVQKLAIESSSLTVEYYFKLLNAVEGLEIVPVVNFFEKIRTVKTDDEIEKIKEAIKITDIAFSNIIQQIQEGMTEKELATIVDLEHSKAGGEYPSFNTIVAFGENTAKPHAQPGNTTLKSGDIITIDFGTFKNGYCSDMTRTFFYGESNNEKLKEIHNIVLEAMNLQIAAVKPGIKASDIDKIGRDYISQKGYGEYFVHGTGHGIGLEIHENPRIIQTNNQELKTGMVFTIEPGIYIEGVGGVRIENDILVTEDGYASLNDSPREYNLLINK